MAKKGKLSLEEMLEQALIKEDEKSYKVPENWVWVSLKSIILPMTTAKPDVNKEYFQYIDIDAIDNKVQVINEPKFIKTSEAPSRASKELGYGNTLFSMVRPYLRNIAYIYKEYEECIGSTGFYVCKPSKGINSRFLFHLLCSEYIITKATSMMRGDNSPSIRNSEFEEIALPLPPLSEQQRIVTLIESLFEKLDRAKELAQNALDSFENIKSAILHKAFTGELTRKWREENTDNTVDILTKIKAARLALCKSNNDEVKIHSEFEIVLTTETDLPSSWLNLKALLICDFITKGETPTKFVSNIGEIPFLKVYNIRNNKLDFTYEPSYIPKMIHDQRMKRSKVLPNDVIMNIVGPPLQKVAIVSNEYAEWNINQAIAIFRPIKDVLPKYLYYCLLCENTLKTVLADTRGVVGQSNISLEQCRNLLIPIAPLSEQNEIVRILDHLLENEQKAKELCNVINKIDHIKKSILAKAFRGELGTNHPEEESALELLKEVLQEKSK